MNSIAFFDRRIKILPITFKDRRIGQRRTRNLFTKQDRRREASQSRFYTREKLIFPVQLRETAKDITGCTENISPGGLLIFGNFFLKQRTPLHIDFSFGNNCILKIPGEVVYCSNHKDTLQNAIGIKFSGTYDFVEKILKTAIEEIKRNLTLQTQSYLKIRLSLDKIPDELINDLFKPFDPNNSNNIKKQLSETSFLQKNLIHTKKLHDKRKKSRKFTSDPEWVVQMDHYLEPFRQAILQGRLVQETSTAKLTLRQVRDWNIQFYPFIESFPQFMALNLAKANDPFSRNFLIDNVRVEKRHADQWIEMAKGFGISKEVLLQTPILPEIEALTHWMWSINSRGSLVEGIAATNYAIEGVTQGIATIMVKGFEKYNDQEGVKLERKAYWWMEAHASYDDLHPFEALEIIKRHATTEELQEKAIHAARRSLEYLYLGLEACYAINQPKTAN